MKQPNSMCACCGRECGASLTFHHLIPKKMHRRNRFNKSLSKQRLSQGIYCCRRCHKGIHKTYDEMTLATHFSSLSALLSDETLRRHFHWVAKQK